MNNPKYIETIREHLCNLLTKSRNNYKTIKRLRERIEDIEMLLKTFPGARVGMLEEELYTEMEFCEKLNDIYNVEINRLALLVLETNTEI
jgi:hypothetical protein